MHNPNNTFQTPIVYECVLDNTNKQEIKYNAGDRKTETQIILSKRNQNAVSLFAGSLALIQGVTYSLPTVNGSGISIKVNGDNYGAVNNTTDIQVIDTVGTVLDTTINSGDVIVPDLEINIFANNVLQTTYNVPVGDLTNINI